MVRVVVGSLMLLLQWEKLWHGSVGRLLLLGLGNLKKETQEWQIFFFPFSILFVTSSKSIRWVVDDARKTPLAG